MSSQAGSREDGRRLSLRTLVIASVASATAAVVTSLFWKGGTPIAAAVTPVIVAVVSELLHRPATVIAARREQTAARVQRTRTLPAAAGKRARATEEPEMKVYRAPSRRPRLAFKPIAATAAIAFVIAAALLTLPELIAGQSFGQGDRNTTLFGGSDKSDSSSSEQETRQDSEPQPQEPAPTQPSQGQDTPEQTTPTAPPAEERAPESGQTPPTPTPAPAAPGEPAP